MIEWEELPCENKVGRSRVAVVINERFDVIRSGSARSVSGIRGRMESRVRAINLSGGSNAARKIRVAAGEWSPLHQRSVYAHRASKFPDAERDRGQDAR